MLKCSDHSSEGKNKLMPVLSCLPLLLSCLPLLAKAQKQSKPINSYLNLCAERLAYHLSHFQNYGTSILFSLFSLIDNCLVTLSFPNIQDNPSRHKNIGENGTKFKSDKLLCQYENINRYVVKRCVSVVVDFTTSYTSLLLQLMM